MKFAFIEAEKATVPVAALCRALKVSTSGFIPASSGRRRHARERTRGFACCAERLTSSRKTYGSPRIHHAHKEQGERVGRKRVVRLMQMDGIKGKRRRRFTRTTDAGHQFPVALNLLNRDFRPASPNQAWAGDVTFLTTPYGFAYLAVVIDLFSSFVVGWSVSTVNDKKRALATLQMALKRRGRPKGLVHRTSSRPLRCRGPRS